MILSWEENQVLLFGAFEFLLDLDRIHLVVVARLCGGVLVSVAFIVCWVCWNLLSDRVFWRQAKEWHCSSAGLYGKGIDF